MPTAEEIANGLRQELEELGEEWATMEQMHNRTLGAPVDLQGIPLKLAFMQDVVLEDIRSTLKEILGHIARIEARRRS